MASIDTGDEDDPSNWYDFLGSLLVGDGAMEALDSVDTLVAQDVINEAKLDAWQSYDHPDITDVGGSEYEYHAPYRTRSLESVLVESETLSKIGISFTPVHELERLY